MDFYFYFVPKVLLYSFVYACVLALGLKFLLKWNKTKVLVFLSVLNFVLVTFFITLYFTRFHPGFTSFRKIPLGNSKEITRTYGTYTHILSKEDLYSLNSFLIKENYLFAETDSLIQTYKFIKWDLQKDDVKEYNITEFKAEYPSIDINHFKGFEQNYDIHWNIFMKYFIP